MSGRRGGQHGTQNHTRDHGLLQSSPATQLVSAETQASPSAAQPEPQGGSQPGSGPPSPCLLLCLPGHVHVLPCCPRLSHSNCSHSSEWALLENINHGDVFANTPQRFFFTMFRTKSRLLMLDHEARGAGLCFQHNIPTTLPGLCTRLLALPLGAQDVPNKLFPTVGCWQNLFSGMCQPHASAQLTPPRHMCQPKRHPP